MAQFPALPLWTDSYLADTMHLDCMESGAYLHLLIAAWRSTDCCLPDDDKRLARFAKCSPRQWAKIKDTVLSFWTLSEHKWSQKRLLSERKFVSGKRDQQIQAGKASALKRKKTGSTDAAPPLQRNGNETPNETATPIPTPIPIDKNIIKNSDDFEELYRKHPRSGKRSEAEKLYNNSGADHQTIMAALDQSFRYWRRNETLEKYLPSLVTWLNDEPWINLPSDHRRPEEIQATRKSAELSALQTSLSQARATMERMESYGSDEDKQKANSAYQEILEALNAAKNQPNPSEKEKT